MKDETAGVATEEFCWLKAKDLFASKGKRYE